MGDAKDINGSIDGGENQKD